GGPPDAVADAQDVLLRRYGAAARRYLLGSLRDADAAEDLAQEFALRFLRGDFKGADPQRGRFRDFLKGVLSHLVAAYHRRRPPPCPQTPPSPPACRSHPRTLTASSSTSGARRCWPAPWTLSSAWSGRPATRYTPSSAFARTTPTCPRRSWPNG